jgi:high-affinity iron transporter
MLEMLIITMREGIEAFLIIAIMAAYLKKTGRHALLPAVWWGTGVAVVLSVAVSFIFAKASNKPLWEGVLAAIAAVLVASMVVYMWRAARHLRAQIGARLEAAAVKPGAAALLGVFAFVLLMITREGMETALLISTLIFQNESRDLIIGALGGLALAALMAWAWSLYGHKVNLARFFQVTAVFLMVFVVQLVIYAFHEFTEANALPINNAYWHLVSEPYGPEGVYGIWLTYLMVIIPAAWLLYTWLRDSNKKGMAPPAVAGSRPQA